MERGLRDAVEDGATDTTKVKGNLNDLGVPAVDLLRHLPGVVDVAVLVSAAKPTTATGATSSETATLSLSARALTDAEVDALYARHLFPVELVQVEREAVLEPDGRPSRGRCGAGL